MIQSKPKTWEISLKKQLKFPLNEIWDVISSKNNLELFHPFCKTNKIIDWCGVNSSDLLIYLNGRCYTRTFLSWHKNKGYTLTIGSNKSKLSYVEWSLYNEYGKNYIKISIYPYLLKKIPRFISYIPYKLYIIPKLKSYLSSVLNGLDFYMNNNKKITKNQFGKHSWFS
ncbi:MAG: hypothetical protein CMD07_06175 [Flavobacteriales bacterium]|nr:hypothetical protein [Flavobacteriales bacterium]|tara:strand:+ start:13315 stop:13821 length:507 start_codon:yes stop_codon:yes gene_type:complete